MKKIKKMMIFRACRRIKPKKNLKNGGRDKPLSPGDQVLCP
jgi:hypothetical protein